MQARYILALKVGIVVFEDLLHRSAIGQQIKDERHPDAMAPDAWLSEADVRIDRNALEQLLFHSFIVDRVSDVGKRTVAYCRIPLASQSKAVIFSASFRAMPTT